MKPASECSCGSRVCPWWFIHAFDNPVRRLLQNPEKILGNLVRPGDACLDLGCGYGYFAIPMARLAGRSGSVVAADIQEEMLAGVGRRAERAGVEKWIRLHRTDASGLQFQNAFDFALAFWMIHEVPDQEATLRQIYTSLKPEGRFLLVEPRGHVSAASFVRTVSTALRVGFTQTAEPRVWFSRAVLLTAN